jgi:hypothetical protein
MQNKYLSALRTKYASYGLSKEALDRVALQRVKTIANEDEIESDIATTDTMLLVMKEIQGSADSQRNRAAQLQKELDDFKKTTQTEQTKNEGDNALAAEIQALKDLVTGYQAEVEAGRKKAHADALLAEVHEVMKAKGCTNDYIRKTTLMGVEIGESDTAESIAEKYKTIYDQNCKEVYGNGYVPPKGNNQGGKDEVNYAGMVEGLIKSGAIPKQV